MYKCRFHLIFTLLLLFLLCGAAQASTTLQVTVKDAIDGTAISQASLYVNGVFQKLTTSDGTCYLTHSGTEDFQIKVTKGGYVDFSTTVGKDQTMVLANMTRTNLNLVITIIDSDNLYPISAATVKVTGNNQTVSKSPDRNGLLTFGVTSGFTYTVEITAPNYYPRTEVVEIAKENKETQFQLVRSDRYSFKVVNRNDMTPVQNAEVYANGAFVGRTDDKGILTTRLDRGTPYSLEVKKAGFITYTEQKTLTNTDVMMTVPLASMPYSVFISVFDESKSPVVGASVYLNGTLKGVTDSYGRFGPGEISGGSYQIEVRQPGFISKGQQIDIIKNGQEITVELSYELADVTVFVQDTDKKVISGARIAANDRDIGATDDHGQLATKLKINTHYNISASKEGYSPAVTDKLVLPGSVSSTVTLTLEKTLDWGFIALMAAGAIAVIAVFAAIRFMGRSGPKRHFRKEGL